MQQGDGLPSNGFGMPLFCGKSHAGALVCAMVLAAGAGGCAGSPLPSGQPAGGAAARASAHGIKATIRITIPKRRHHRRILIHGHYVSSATRSIAIAVTPPGGSPANFNADLTPATNPHCAGSPVVCTI